MQNLFSKNLIVLNYNATSKEDVIKKMASMLNENGYLNDMEAFIKEIKKREEINGTGIEEHIAMPHAKGNFIKKHGIAILRVVGNGFDFNSSDQKLSKLFFMMALPEETPSNAHIKAISYLSNTFSNNLLRHELMSTNNEDRFLEIILNNDNINESNNLNTKKDFILAVTACPVGIAHTYMAAESLKKAALELNINIKVETNGSSGTENPITEEEIKKAKGVIIASGKTIDKERFSGKPLIEVGVKDGIHKAKELIQTILKNEAPIYKKSNTNKTTETLQKQNKKTGIYKHLMNGVSFMLPFVVSGGIIIAISFMFGIKAFDINDPSYNKIADILMQIGGGSAFALMIPILAGYISFSIAERPGLAPGMITGLMMSNGNAGFLGGILAGFTSGYVTLTVKKISDKIIPSNLRGINPVLTYPFLSVIISGILIYGMLSPISVINESITNMLNQLSGTNMAILGALLGGMMAIDMGGPVNKAAYAFGIAMITAKNYIPHASIMAGGMIPPIGIALATSLFKNRFSKEERESGKVCYFLGACFITEGVIPFAAADPLRVIPACILGSSVGGFISALFKVEVIAPHGGIFILPIVVNPLMWITSILVGSIITAVLIGILKKEYKNIND
ncbi:pts system, fructose-specific iiabc component [Borreliella burgdorferi 29805]|uniref:Pts system, fructose-specific iiabc component n=3 Tax=Borreliella burgdorferi TaxID=139 RepID=A0A7U8F029_BORBG|nr:fructose-specific PTS transporter subunit EIIC [Borreliella burgdorferi]AXK70611.1 PTS system, fructose-specific IIABC components [Borreliella burgdorferi]EEF83723.1 pts system, fructose-specific iiabc component [Borreliella burgdorferi CA-11.2A]EEG98968.1 pts system, fructose-specific iiabc component [Borreliella burgdorferi 118a]EEG99964.1 pts system, fructose-specific iiabc component [Borreliella burgdorferi 94a]EEH32948.1 pts system, fructose-specific iiabc component [Borreliella burgdo